MSFSTDWLDMREPFDHAARAPDLLASFIESLESTMRGGRIVDLGGGTGSTMRACAVAGLSGHSWTVIEHDQTLIAAGMARHPELAYVQGDLARDLEVLIPKDAVAITASALLDLVSRDWLERLVRLCAERRLLLCAALTYDGGMRWRPGDVFDARIKELFDRHQHGDKGFGPALGPDAVAALEASLAPLGGRMLTAASDWVFEPQHADIQTVLLDGYARAALEIAPAERLEIEAWQGQRLGRVEQGRSRHRVGHRDVLWFPE